MEPLKKELIERIRAATGERMIENMTPAEIDATFQRLHEENAKLREEVVTLKRTYNQLFDAMQKERERAEKAEAAKDKYHAMAVYAGSIMEKSEGVAGWHLNGDIAKWDELFTTDAYKSAIDERDREQQAKGIENFIQPYADGHTKEFVKGGYGREVLYSAKCHIEQLHKNSEK